MPLFDDSSFDFGDFVSGGDPIDFDWSNVDFGGGSYGGFDFDLSSLPDFGFDLSSINDIADAFNFDNVDLGIFDQYDTFDVDTAPNFGFDITQSTDAEAQDGGFYGNTPGAYYDPRTNLTTLYDESGNLRDFVTHEGGAADIGGGSYDVESQPGGFYGNTPNATYDPRTNTTTIRNDQGEVVRTVYHGGGPGAGGGGAGGGGGGGRSGPGTGISRDNALLMALLGGLLGLLGRGSAPRIPVGYQGGIPKYTAARVPGRGVEYTRAAAGGGLMDLAGGGRPARYLRGGTDGMADKIKTDIDGKQPARLSHGEFVIPADVVSHLGNGNSDAGADVLYDMMAKVRKARTGTTKQGKQINPRKMIPA